MRNKKLVLLVLVLALAALLLAGCQSNDTALREEITALQAEVKTAFDAVHAKADAMGMEASDAIHGDIEAARGELDSLTAQIEDSAFAKKTTAELTMIKEGLITLKGKVETLATDTGAAVQTKAQSIWEQTKAAYDELQAKLAALGEHATDAMRNEAAELGGQLTALEERVKDSKLVTWAGTKLAALRTDLAKADERVYAGLTTAGETIRVKATEAIDGARATYEEAKQKAEALGESASAELKAEVARLGGEITALETRAKDSAFVQGAQADIRKATDEIESLWTRAKDALTKAGDEADAKAKEAWDAAHAQAVKVHDEAQAALAGAKTSLDTLGDKASAEIKAEYDTLKADLDALGERIADSKAAALTEEELGKVKTELEAMKEKIAALVDKVTKAE